MYKNGLYLLLITLLSGNLFAQRPGTPIPIRDLNTSGASTNSDGEGNLLLGVRSFYIYHLSATNSGNGTQFFISKKLGSWSTGIAYGNYDMPISSATDPDGSTNRQGTGEKSFQVMDLMLKYHLWFAQNAWVGIGFGFYNFSSGYLHFTDSSVNKYINLNQSADTKTLFTGYFGFGFRVPLVDKKVYFNPQVLVPYALNDANFLGVRVNFGISTSMNFQLF